MKSPFRLPTQRATEVVFQAAQEAIRTGAEEVEPDHILLALTEQPESMAGRILTGFGVSLAVVRDRLEAPPAAECSRSPGEGLLMSADAQLAVDYAYQEACGLGNLFIGVEHLLLGLLRCPNCEAERILGALGVDAARFREGIHRMKWG
jgi:ATP-dependent Clp protease ATP-binding subunit ClpB